MIRHGIVPTVWQDPRFVELSIVIGVLREI
jgi:hypothetical protein